jgi:hypothetical protein
MARASTLARARAAADRTPRRPPERTAAVARRWASSPASCGWSSPASRSSRARSASSRPRSPPVHPAARGGGMDGRRHGAGARRCVCGRDVRCVRGGAPSRPGARMGRCRLARGDRLLLVARDVARRVVGLRRGSDTDLERAHRRDRRGRRRQLARARSPRARRRRTSRHSRGDGTRASTPAACSKCSPSSPTGRSGRAPSRRASTRSRSPGPC